MRLTGPEPPRGVGYNLRDTVRHTGVSTLGAGFVAFLLGATGPALLVYQAATNAGYPSGVIDSWFFAIYVGGGLLSLLLAYLYREPICGAFPIAGSALLVTVLAEYSLSEAVGAFLLSGVLVALLGLSGLFDSAMERIPNEVIMGALAGILLHFGVEVFAALPGQPLLVGAMVAAYLVAFRFLPALPPALLALVVGLVVAGVGGQFDVGDVRLSLSQPVLVWPSFDLAALFSIALPLTLLAVATQNAPGVGILWANGYRPPVNAITIFSGLGSILTAPLAGNGLNIAAPMTAVCAGPEAHPDPENRYLATVAQGVFFIAFGLVGATAVSLIRALPPALILSLAGLALLPVILQALRLSVGGTRHTVAAGIALFVGASNLTILGINSAFWAIVVGVALARFLRQDSKGD
ncbi:MAG: benzoate/H(+) symporter BenE family transporter [Actinomycetota bacterium]|nr:benzoate/H(+) symporter BenE family transporter [Actinomycetota bacterium]